MLIALLHNMLVQPMDDCELDRGLVAAGLTWAVLLDISEGYMTSLVVRNPTEQCVYSVCLPLFLLSSYTYAL